MNNNDILRRLRYAFDFKDAAMVEIFAAADHTVTQEQVVNWLRKEDDAGYCAATDTELAIFLNGFINTRRGKREGAQPTPEKRLTNNMIFMKLKIALNMTSDDILETLKASEFCLSKHELSAFFRKPDNKHYRECKDQILRNFLMGVQHTFRTGDTPSA
ncbi:uncharacterized protein YehS (DUF1456 family) [Marinobacterium halophilum]|uniref:Uncharacterized protein YehS (DUF1456 family) n=1 Tax=Marinobacterium halophilum TaxID=267374 RepID=A0A2P8ETF8_9GAMM|nr:DUF1456 family protein [Marinobacterium halophilum]PSL12734.1 uncharacterized protein YehS (DUF1456 family) [Marinobacterium halophilum]